MGGGRYNGLVEEMGGPPTPSVGWGAGIERLAMLMEAAGATPEAAQPVHVMPVSEAEEPAALAALQALRAAGVSAEMAYRGNLKRRMERANKARATLAVIVGAEELARGAVRVRDLDHARQFDVVLPEALRFEVLAGLLRRAAAEAGAADRLALAIATAGLDTFPLA